MNEVIKYNDGEIEVSISIKAIYKEEELFENSTIRKLRIVEKEGKREVARDISHYNLDLIVSVGYRVSSYKATKFRQWATNLILNDEWLILNEKKAA